MTGCRVTYDRMHALGGMDCDGDADASGKYLERLWREHAERTKGADMKTKKERAAASRENANWLELEAAIDDLRGAAKKRDKDSTSIAFECVEEAMSRLVIGEERVTDAD